MREAADKELEQEQDAQELMAQTRQELVLEQGPGSEMAVMVHMGNFKADLVKITQVKEGAEAETTSLCDELGHEVSCSGGFPLLMFLLLLARVGI